MSLYVDTYVGSQKHSLASAHGCWSLRDELIHHETSFKMRTTDKDGAGLDRYGMDMLKIAANVGVSGSTSEALAKSTQE